MFATAYNTTDVPLVVDPDGRTIGGREWGTVETTDEPAARELDGGRLVLVDHPDGPLDDDAAAAFARTAAADERATRLDRLRKPQLVDLAVTAGLDVDPDDPPHKPDLVSRLARRTDVDVPDRKADTTSDDDTDTTTEEA